MSNSTTNNPPYIFSKVIQSFQKKYHQFISAEEEKALSVLFPISFESEQRHISGAGWKVFMTRNMNVAQYSPASAHSDIWIILDVQINITKIDNI